MFHLNDKAHGTWSVSALGALYIDITARCGTKIPCLTPYAPSETVIRGGTYYAFHPDNGVVEYAAELALRYYREQRAMILPQKLAKPPCKSGASEPAGARTRGRAQEGVGPRHRSAVCSRDSNAIEDP
jgi:hypothetical protein